MNNFLECNKWQDNYRENIYNYYKLKYKKLCEISLFNNKVSVDELFLSQKEIISFENKYDNIYEIKVKSAIAVAMVISNKFKEKNYEVNFTNTVQYLVKRFYICNENNFYNTNNIAKNIFSIEDNNISFNIKKYFNKKTIKFIPEFIELIKDNNQNHNINENIVSILDYYKLYGKYKISYFNIDYFIMSYENTLRNLTALNIVDFDNFKFNLNNIPIDMYNQNNITLTFINKQKKIEIKDIHFYYDFVFKLYGRNNSNEIYHEIANINGNDYSEYLILANTKDGAVIIKDGYVIQKFEGFIITEDCIDLQSNLIKLKSKKDFLTKKIEDTFNNNYYSILHLDNEIKFLEYRNFYDMKLPFYKKIVSKDFLIFYITKEESKMGYVLEEIIKNMKYEIIDNIFSDDNSINYKIYVPSYDLEKIFLLKYIQDHIGYGKIYNIPIKDIVHFIVKDGSYFREQLKFYNISINKHDDLSNNYLYKLNNVIETIIQKIMELKKLNTTEAIQYLIDNYINDYNENNLILNHYFSQLSMENDENYKHLASHKQYNTIPKFYKDYLKTINLPNIKWKSEFSLYKIVKNLYPDAIHQFRANWLNKLSLDIFIPSISIAIEYQGKQHYKEVDYFNNDLLRQQENDSYKKSLCEQNGIILLEWLYNEPISEITLYDKLGYNIIKTNIFNKPLHAYLDKLNEFKTKNDLEELRIKCDLTKNIDTLINLKQQYEEIYKFNSNDYSGIKKSLYENYLISLKGDISMFQKKLEIIEHIKFYADLSLNKIVELKVKIIEEKDLK